MLRNNPELNITEISDGSVSVLHAISPNASRTFTMSARWPTKGENGERKYGRQ